MSEIASMIRSFSNDTLPYKGSPPEAYEPRLAIFGTSSDPPHLGHQAVVEMLVNSGNYDEVWVLPVYVHMFSSKDASLTPFDHRMAMCKLAFEGSSTTTCVVRVLPMEKLVCEAAAVANDGKPIRVGSSLILKIVHTLYPGSVGQTTFVLGSDTFLDLVSGKWKNAKNILQENRIAVVERGMVRNGEGETAEKAPSGGGEGLDPISKAIATCTVVDPKELRVSRFASQGHLDVSSSLVRGLVSKLFSSSIQDAVRDLGAEGPQTERKDEGDGELRAAVHPKVLDYVFKQGLYVATNKNKDEIFDV
jgi:nicotinate (nicotinamide) nucleotide adenylyltransferase